MIHRLYVILISSRSVGSLAVLIYPLDEEDFCVRPSLSLPCFIVGHFLPFLRLRHEKDVREIRSAKFEHPKTGYERTKSCFLRCETSIMRMYVRGFILGSPHDWTFYGIKYYSISLCLRNYFFVYANYLNIF